MSFPSSNSISSGKIASGAGEWIYAENGMNLNSNLSNSHSKPACIGESHFVPSTYKNFRNTLSKSVIKKRSQGRLSRTRIQSGLDPS